MEKYHFISYSAVDGFDVALRLCDALMVVDNEGLLVEVRNAAAGAAAE